MVGDSGQWNQHYDYLQLFLHLWACSQALSRWRRGSSMWGWIFQSHAFIIPIVSQYCLELMTVPVGMNHVCTMPLTSQKTVNKTLPTNTVVLTFFSAGDLLQQNSTDCVLFSGLNWCTTNCWPISTALTHLQAAHIYNYSLQSLTQNGYFVHYFLLRNTTILFNASVNKTQDSGEPHQLQFMNFCYTVSHSGSGRPIRALHHKYVRPNAEQYSCF